MNSASNKEFIRPLHSKLQAVSRILDVFIIISTLYISLIIYQIPNDDEYLLPCFITTALFGVFAENNELYQGWRGSPMFDESLRIMFSWLGAFALMVTGAYVFNAKFNYSLNVVQLWLPLAPTTIILTHTIRRYCLSYLRTHGFNTRTYAIYGANTLGVRLKLAISELPWLGFKFVGFYDDKTEQEGRLSNSEIENYAGDFEQMLQETKDGNIDHIYLTLPLTEENRISFFIEQLADTTASVNVVPDFFTFNLIQSKWSSIQGLPVVSVFDTPFDSLDGVTKRIEDLLLCSVILPLISIPMLLIAIAIKLTSPGPVIFKQQRYGVNGENIYVWKFRSMTVCENGDTITQATQNDRRLTSIGGFLRKSSLDELPQFINVLQGTMSVVGPRPHAIAHNEFYRKQIRGYMLRHKVKPGITGHAQINGYRGETDTLDKMEARINYDLEYIKKWSLWLDIKIVFLTIFKGFYSKQAY